MTAPRLPDLLPGQCGSCGLIDQPMEGERCHLCASRYGPSSPPEHIASILPRVLERIAQRQAEDLSRG